MEPDRLNYISQPQVLTKNRLKIHYADMGSGYILNNVKYTLHNEGKNEKYER
jgi:hypothetical protein